MGHIIEIPELIIASSEAQMAKLQSDAILALEIGERPRCILEAGCGRRWAIELKGLRYTLTGLDLDPVALEIRKTSVKDLDVAICGDLCTADLAAASFDVIYSSWVLEHVPRADVALENFVKWLRPGGVLIVRIPDRNSVRGFLARVLPHQFHIWYYRFAYSKEAAGGNAGKPGYPPYRTCYHPVLNRDEFCRFLVERGIENLCCYADGYRRDSEGRLANMIIKTSSRLVEMFSCGRLTARYADVLYIGSKKT